MKTVIITNAGISSRFNRGVPERDVCLKAIYHTKDPKDTLLYHMLEKCDFAQRIVLVGGYRYEELQTYVNEMLPREYSCRMEMVYNPYFEKLSSGYSLYLGLKHALSVPEVEEIVFIEGDLDFDRASFDRVVASTKSVVTWNPTPIYADKAVVLYQNGEGALRYAFNASHGLLNLEEPFSGIFHSGQVWKFTDMDILRDTVEHFGEGKMDGTNLVLIGDYLDRIPQEEVELVGFADWTNCNTREDFAAIEAGWRKDE